MEQRNARINIFRRQEVAMEFIEVNEIDKKTDLEKELRRLGISEQHIKYIKNTKPQVLNDFINYYERDEDRDKINVLVQPYKIVDIPRANNQESLYSNAAGVCESELDIGRMTKAICHIKNDSLQQIYYWYEDMYHPISLNYYEEDDCFAVGGDGNHRALYALIVNAPAIKANVYYWRKNNASYEAYLKYKEACKLYGLEYIHIPLQNYLNKRFYFVENDYSYYVEGYTDPKTEKSGIYDLDKVNKLISELRSDWKYLKHKWLINFLHKHVNLALKLLKTINLEENQQKRLWHHIIRNADR